MAAKAVAKVTRKAAKPKSARRKAEPKTAGPSPAEVLARVISLGNTSAAQFAQRFFKTGEGQYGAGDQFLGIRVPVLRAMVRDLRGVGLEVALPLMKSGWHEARALGLMLLVKIYQRGDESTQKKIYDLYLKSTRFINNWDLVDLSAEHIVGPWLADKPAERKRVLTRLAKSKSLWERRIAMLATFHYIKQGDYAETLRIAELLLKDDEDLIQKAVGWMLREVGKRIGEDKEESFLKRHYRQMPRTMLRYAIERFAEPKRKRYLAGLI
ncbi:MAG: DNA alkylation repair protein [Betaproteobacteria bacterium]|nr:DNA alkylation repair protein [Betaproteobacteria bacterium]